MLPILWTSNDPRFPLVLSGYGFFLCVAISTLVALLVRASARAGIDAALVLSALAIAIAGAFVGASTLSIFVQWIEGRLHQGFGLVFYGAALGAGGSFYGACRLLRLPFGPLADLAAPLLPLAHAIGRLGCLMGGCCFGAPWQGPWALRMTHPLAPAAHPVLWRHPTALYEGLGLLLLAAFGILWPPRQIGEGRRFLRYVALYAGLRFLVEAFRGDRVRGVFAALSTSQWIALACLAWAAWRLWAMQRRPRDALTYAAPAAAKSIFRVDA